MLKRAIRKTTKFIGPTSFTTQDTLSDDLLGPGADENANTATNRKEYVTINSLCVSFCIGFVVLGSDVNDFEYAKVTSAISVKSLMGCV